MKIHFKVSVFAQSWIMTTIGVVNFRVSLNKNRSPPWRIKIAMPCLRINLRDESLTASNSPLVLLYPDVKSNQFNPIKNRLITA